MKNDTLDGKTVLLWLDDNCSVSTYEVVHKDNGKMSIMVHCYSLITFIH